MTESYVGRDNLEAMKLAINYNAALAQLVHTYSTGREALDFGAGAGVFSSLLKRRGVNVTCVEPDEALFTELKAMGFAAFRGIDEVPTASLVFVFSLNVLEHIHDDALVLRQIFERLRPGGRLLLYVPAFAILFSAMDRRVGHFRRYRRKSLAALLQHVGFVIDDARYADSLGFLATLVYKVVGDPDGGLNTKSLTFYDRYVFPVSRFIDVALRGAIGKNLIVVAHKAHAARG